MIFALFLQLAQIFDTSGENPHNSEQTELRLQQRWKVQFVTAMSQPVQLVLCVLLLNLRFRHLWLIYSRITTLHYGARCDILKTKLDSDGAGKKSACKIISEPFQRPQRCFPHILLTSKIQQCVTVCFPLHFHILTLLKCVFKSCFPVCAVESILVAVCCLWLNASCFILKVLCPVSWVQAFVVHEFLYNSAVFLFLHHWLLLHSVVPQ